MDNSKMSKQKLASMIWESANKLRGNLEANEYKNYILGLILYKFLSQKQIDYMIKREIDIEDFKYFDSSINLNEIDFDKTVSLRGKDDVYNHIENIKEDCGYFIPYNFLYQTWKNKDWKKENNFSSKLLNDAITEFNRNIAEKTRDLFEGIFQIFESGLSSLGSSITEQTKLLSELMDTIDDIPTNKQNYDVLGFIYEYLISKFASSAGKKGGEFYTPHEVSVLMSQVVAHYLKDRETISVYDPTSGSGSLLLTMGESFKKYNKRENSITYYAQEKIQSTYNLTRMNLVMNNINPVDINVRCGDTLEKDWPFFKNNDDNQYIFRSVDAVVSNPPYSLIWDPTNKEHDARFTEYGIAPKSKADLAFLLHDLYHLKPDGIMTIVLPHGVLFRGGSEKDIRQKLIEKGQIDTIIGLPSNIFYGTGIATIIMVLKKQKEGRDIQFVDASKLFVKEDKNNKLLPSHIKKIVDVVNNKKEVENFSKVISFEEIQKNDYNLNISRYIDNFNKSEEFDLYSLMFGVVSQNELKKLKEFWEQFPGLKSKLFNSGLNDYNKMIKNDDNQIRNTILENQEINLFLDKFRSIGRSLEELFKTKFKNLSDVQNISEHDFEDEITEFIFNLVKGLKLVDSYGIYQLWMNHINEFNEDVKLIQKYPDISKPETLKELLLEQLNVQFDKKTKQVITWNSSIFSYELLANKFLSDSFDEISSIKEQIESTQNEIKEIFESIEDEDKSNELLFKENEFDKKELEKEVKNILKQNNTYPIDSLENKLIQAFDLYKKISEYNKSVKNKEKELNQNSYEKYLSLNELEFIDLLINKWTSGFKNQAKELGINIIEDYISKLEHLQEKYNETLFDINQNISNSQNELSNMFSELTGDETDVLAINELINIFKANK
ncbi:type I restriction-modification system subunit M [Mycoplasmopsis felis]|uniref:type I restriction-modification system subunit M n=1 Tax=Mycoplasmopsis felis TaxID=33923 RepID=UPI002AFE070E|nr:type I restriction-modification system subunit M [Mycoplasmopsis felis]WQQ08868.1 type I restriction-modification system subunit M [Mycoplasmopsis felis]